MGESGACGACPVPVIVVVFRMAFRIVYEHFCAGGGFLRIDDDVGLEFGLGGLVVVEALRGHEMRSVSMYSTAPLTRFAVECSACWLGIGILYAMEVRQEVLVL